MSSGFAIRYFISKLHNFIKVEISKIFQRKIMNIFLPSVLTFVLDAYKNTSLRRFFYVPTHNVCFS